MAPHIDTRTWTYGAVSRRTLTQDTADANYMLLTVVVNMHNCVVLLSAAVAMDGNATEHAASSICVRLCTTTQRM